MGFRNFRGRRFAPRMRPVINSIKNETSSIDALVASTNTTRSLVIADDTHDTAVASSVINGCIIKAVWIEFWYYGLSAGNTNDIIDIYLIKNPGNNLTLPNPGTTGQSNEKKFIFHEWRGLGGNKSLGGVPYNQKGRWFKIPKRYQRFGTDDRLQLVARSPTTGNFCLKSIYKWYT